MKLTYKHTLFASFTGYISQAIVNNLAPLLFVTFQNEFAISIDKIGYIIFVNFFVQILVDMCAAKYADRIGYRKCVCFALALNVIGFVGLGTLPYMVKNHYAAIMGSIVVSAMGGGLLEVVISPIVEAIPGDAKSAKMSLLHSFYCWGQVGVVLVSTAYFMIFGIANWKYLCFIWALVPLFNMIMFMKVPLCKLVEEQHQVPFKQLAKNKVFWVFFVLMLGAGAAELSMSQWSSLFAEVGLKVSKSVGDVLGMCMFAVLMGLARVYFATYGNKIKIENGLLISSILCVIAYLMTAFSHNAILALIGCALCGLSVGLMWPGTYSLASKVFPGGGTAMFAMLAFAGDIGCSVGPTIVGNISNAIQKLNVNILPNLIFGTDMTEVGLKTGLGFSCVFPFVMIILLIMLKRKMKK